MRASVLVSLWLFLATGAFGQVPRVGELDLGVSGVTSEGRAALRFQATNRGGRRLTFGFPAGMPFVPASRSAPTMLLERDLELVLSPGETRNLTVGAYPMGTGQPSGAYRSSDDPALDRPVRIVHTVNDLETQGRLQTDRRTVVELALAAHSTRDLEAVRRRASSAWPDVENTLMRATPGAVVLPGSQAVYQVEGGKDAFGSSYPTNCSGSPFEGGRWGSAQGGSDWAQRTFLGTHGVVEIQIRRASTDITTEGFRLAVKLRGRDGAWILVDELRDTNINRTALSGGRSGRSLPDYRKRLERPIPADAIRIEFSGHGWFDLEDVEVFAAPVF
ncbi:MAG: hypothetical protein HY319_07355 [Armatimonadetes bacterium]|nr:hypothetical protein [Armatimonadota bacterium]